MIKILLVGYGKMGQCIHENIGSIYPSPNIEIYDPFIEKYATPLSDRDISDIDVALEFTHPDSGYKNIQSLLEYKIPVITGTTGWFHKIDELKQQFSPKEYTLIYGANFSVGMNLFYQIVEHGSKLIGQTKQYDVFGIEAHHRKKADAPSGTAKTLSEIILTNTSDKDKVIYDLSSPLKENEFGFSSIRAGNIFGYHEIGFDSDFDEIKLVHNAKNRKGFAMGAILSIKYALAHKGFYNFRDIFSQVISA